MRNVCNLSVWNSEGCSLLGKPRRTGDDNIKLDLKVIWREDVEWIHLAQDRDQRRYRMNIEPSVSIKDVQFLEQLNND
jgi:hypothetical protein